MALRGVARTRRRSFCLLEQTNERWGVLSTTNSVARSCRRAHQWSGLLGQCRMSCNAHCRLSDVRASRDESPGTKHVTGAATAAYLHTSQGLHPAQLLLVPLHVLKAAHSLWCLLYSDHVSFLQSSTRCHGLHLPGSSRSKAGTASFASSSQASTVADSIGASQLIVQETTQF